MIEKLDTTKLEGNKSASYEEVVKIPYDDIQVLADKINEIIEHLNQQEEKNKPCEHGFRLGSGGAYCDCWSSSNGL